MEEAEGEPGTSFGEIIFFVFNCKIAVKGHMINFLVLSAIGFSKSV